MSIQGGHVEGASILVGDYESFTDVRFVRCSILIGATQSRATFLGCTFHGCKIDRRIEGKLSYWEHCWFDTDCEFGNEEDTTRCMQGQRGHRA